MTDLRARLAAARTRLRLAAAARASLLAASVALISLLTLAVIDALSPLAPLARLIALIGIAFFTLFIALRAAVRDGLLAPLPLDRIARAIERRTGAIDNALINALQLSPAASTADALPRALAERAIDRAERRLDETPPTSAIDPAPLKRSGALFTISTLAVAIIFLTVPRLPAFAAPRLLEPFGGHPPFTWTDFSITIDPAQPIIGDDARITVDLDGRIPTALGFIAESADPTARRAWPMTAASETRYTTLLRNLRDPIRFHVAGDTGRSRTITIDPIAQPRVQRAALRLTPPAYTNLPPRELDLRSPFATPHTVLLGTRAELTITSTLPIADLEHTGFDETTVESTTITAARTFTTPGDVRLSLTARAASGIAFPAPVVATIRVIPDAPPAIEIAAPAAPGEEVLASPTASIPIRAAARDDIALSRFTLTVTRPSTDASRELDLLESPTDSQRIAPGLARLDLASINAAPGEVLELAFFATDNRPADFGGAQRTTTAPIRIRIIEDAEMQSRSEEQQGASTSDPGAAMPADDPSDAASESPRLFPAEPTESDNEAPSESADQSSDSSSTDSTPSQAESAAPGAAAPSPESAPDAQRPRDAQADPASDAPSDHGVTILSSRTVDPAELQALLGADAPSYYESGSSAALDTGTIPTSAASISIVPATYRDLAARYLLELNRLEQRLAHPENDQ